MNIDKIIEIIRTLKEEGAPTMSTASTAGKPGFSGTADAKGPTAGYDQLLGFDGRSKIARRLPPFYRKDLIQKKKKRKR